MAFGALAIQPSFTLAPPRAAQGMPADCDIAAEILRNFPAVVRDHGGNPDALLGDAGIDPALLGKAGVKLPLLTVGDLLERAAYALGVPDIGIRMAECNAGPVLVAPLDQLICNAPTLQDVWRCCASHMRAFSSGLRFTLEHDDDRELHALRLDFPLQHRPGLSQLVEHIALITHDGARHLTRSMARARVVTFTHLPLGARSRYARAFDTTVEFGGDFDQLFFTGNAIRASVVDRDEAVFARATSRIAARFPAQIPGIVAEARDALRHALAQAMSSREDVAGLMRIHPRTLHRRLSHAGVTFEELRDEVRRDLTLRYLLRDDLSLTDVAGRLGFSELAVFSRACRRWFGAAPSRLRRDARRPARPH